MPLDAISTLSISDTEYEALEVLWLHGPERRDGIPRAVAGPGVETEALAQALPTPLGHHHSRAPRGARGD